MHHTAFPLRPPYPQPPKREAIRALQDAFTRLHPSHARWTQADAIHLGQLYVAAWGRLPNAARLSTTYGLPSAATILHLFGSYAAYYATLEVTHVHP